MKQRSLALIMSLMLIVAMTAGCTQTGTTPATSGPTTASTSAATSAPATSAPAATATAEAVGESMYNAPGEMPIVLELLP